MLLLLCLDIAGKRHHEPSAHAEVLGSMNEAVLSSREASQMKLKESELPHHYFLVCFVSSGGICCTWEVNTRTACACTQEYYSLAAGEGLGASGSW